MAHDNCGEDRSKPADGGKVVDGLPEGTIDNICRAVADRHRRRILGYLMETDEGTATLDELLDLLVSISPHSSTRRRVALHNHLAILDERGIIEYDRRSNTARYHGHQLVEEVLACVEAASAYDYRLLADSEEE